MIEIEIYVKDLKVTNNNLLNEAKEESFDTEDLLDLISPTTINEDVKGKLTVKDGKKQVRILIRDRKSYGKSDNLISHGASIKVMDPKEKVGEQGVPIRRDDKSGEIIIGNPKVAKMKLSSTDVGKEVFKAAEKRLNILWDKYNDEKKQEKLLKQITNDILNAGIEIIDFTIEDNPDITNNLNKRAENRRNNK